MRPPVPLYWFYPPPAMPMREEYAQTRRLVICPISYRVSMRIELAARFVVAVVAFRLNRRIRKPSCGTRRRIRRRCLAPYRGREVHKPDEDRTDSAPHRRDGTAAGLLARSDGDGVPLRRSIVLGDPDERNEAVRIRGHCQRQHHLQRAPSGFHDDCVISCEKSLTAFSRIGNFS
jgi:hypothetical protein